MTKAIGTLGTGGKYASLINNNELKQSNFWKLDNQLWSYDSENSLLAASSHIFTLGTATES